MNPYEPSKGGVEYRTLILSTSSNMNGYSHRELDIHRLNTLAKDDWRVVQMTATETLTVLLLERKLQ